MKNRRTREQWLRDVAASQRNVVFPDTADNEGRFWRNVMSGKRRLTIVQVIGFAAMGMTLIVVLASLILDEFRSPYPRVTIQFLISRFGGYLIPLVVLGLFLLLIKITSQRVRKP